MSISMPVFLFLATRTLLIALCSGSRIAFASLPPLNPESLYSPAAMSDLMAILAVFAVRAVAVIRLLIAASIAGLP
jgi:hypothetical protein